MAQKITFNTIFNKTINKISEHDIDVYDFVTLIHKAMVIYSNNTAARLTDDMDEHDELANKTYDELMERLNKIW